MSSGRRGKQQQTQAEKPGFTAHVYEGDHQAIKELVQQYPTIETGGDLFGLWQDESTVVIQLFIGPGKKCERTAKSFHQDIDYLHKVGSVITTEEGLCNVGEWHSHHQIGMPGPSSNDCRTVFSNMPQLGLERFVLFIASIETNAAGKKSHKRPRDVKLGEIVLRPFLFLGPEQKFIQGTIKEIPGPNPYSFSSRVIKKIEEGKEPGELVKRKVSVSDEEVKTDKKEQGRKDRGATAEGETAVKPGDTSNEKRKEVPKNGREKENQTWGREVINIENVSPNPDSATRRVGTSPSQTAHFPPPPKNVLPPSGPAQGLGSGHQGRNMPNITQTQQPAGLWQHWENSRQPGSAQGGGRGSSSTQMPQQMGTASQFYIPSSQGQPDPRLTRQSCTSQGKSGNAILIGGINATGHF